MNFVYEEAKKKVEEGTEELAKKERQIIFDYENDFEGLFKVYFEEGQKDELLYYAIVRNYIVNLLKLIQKEDKWKRKTYGLLRTAWWLSKKGFCF